jgi:serine/threonine-protein kinase
VRPDDDRPTVDLGPRELEDPIPGTVDVRVGVVAGAAPPADDLGGDPDDDPEGDHGGAATDHDEVAVLDNERPTPTRTMVPAVDPIHSHPTQQLSRRRHVEGESKASQHTKFSTTSSPIEALRLDEIARTRFFLRMVVITGLLGVVANLVSRSGDPIALRIVLAGCVTVCLGAFWFLLIIRKPESYTAPRIAAPAIVIGIGAYAGVYYWGVASPATAMILYGIYFFSLGADRTITLFMYVLVAALHGLLGGGILFGLIDDRGIVSIRALPKLDQMTILMIVQGLYFIAYYTARVSQRVTLQTVLRLEQAVRGVAQREALLAEARAELDRALKVGGPGRFTEQVVGGYRLGVLIGRGGMGEVYEAHSVSDQREAAVKLLHAGTLADPNQVARFLREADICARLDCPNVVRVLEVGTTAGEIPFLAMERLRGNDLAHQLRRQRRLPLTQVATLVEHIAVGLEAARAAGIVHRDLKPHNVFQAEVGPGRVWKILDFGVSKSGGTGTLTKGHVIGTPAYMAPEQARGEDVDHRADVYSLAAIIYRSVTGHPAFTGKDVPTTLYDVVYRVPTQPTILATLPTDLDRVLALGLAKDARDRFATAAELARWFALAIDDRLGVEQRRQADDVIARHPWGTRPSGASSLPPSAEADRRQ